MSTLAEPGLRAPAPPARFFEREADGRLRCTLCPRDCLLGEGQAGFCSVRENRGGEMVLLAYGKSTGFAVDPIEKKPLYHFLPGTEVLSFGTVGCNLGCRFCQNWNISKAKASGRGMESHTPEQVVDLAVSAGCPSIAFTYNDPIIWAEWAIDVAREARRRGIRTVFVTSGYVEEKAREEIFSWMDAANVDLKGFTEDFYAKVTLSHLAPVLETLEWLARGGRVWTEVTNLLIPGLNDDPGETRRLSEWVGAHMGPDVPAPLLRVSPCVEDERPAAHAPGDAHPRPPHRARGRAAPRLHRQRPRPRGADDLLPGLRQGGGGAGLERGAREPARTGRDLPGLRGADCRAFPGRLRGPEDASPVGWRRRRRRWCSRRRRPAPGARGRRPPCRGRC